MSTQGKSIGNVSKGEDLQISKNFDSQDFQLSQTVNMGGATIESGLEEKKEERPRGHRGTEAEVSNQDSILQSDYDGWLAHKLASKPPAHEESHPQAKAATEGPMKKFDALKDFSGIMGNFSAISHNLQDTQDLVVPGEDTGIEHRYLEQSKSLNNKSSFLAGEGHMLQAPDDGATPAAMAAILKKQDLSSIEVSSNQRIKFVENSFQSQTSHHENTSFTNPQRADLDETDGVSPHPLSQTTLSPIGVNKTGNMISQSQADDMTQSLNTFMKNQEQASGFISGLTSGIPSAPNERQDEEIYPANVYSDEFAAAGHSQYPFPPQGNSRQEGRTDLVTLGQDGSLKNKDEPKRNEEEPAFPYFPPATADREEMKISDEHAADVGGLSRSKQQAVAQSTNVLANNLPHQTNLNNPQTAVQSTANMREYLSPAYPSNEGARTAYSQRVPVPMINQPSSGSNRNSRAILHQPVGASDYSGEPIRFNNLSSFQTSNQSSKAQLSRVDHVQQKSTAKVIEYPFAQSLPQQTLDSTNVGTNMHQSANRAAAFHQGMDSSKETYVAGDKEGLHESQPSSSQVSQRTQMTGTGAGHGAKPSTGHAGAFLMGQLEQEFSNSNVVTVNHVEEDQATMIREEMRHDSSREGRATVTTCEILDQSSKQPANLSFPKQQFQKMGEDSQSRMLEVDSEGHETFRSPRAGNQNGSQSRSSLNQQRSKSRASQKSRCELSRKQLPSALSNFSKGDPVNHTQSSALGNRFKERLPPSEARINKSGLVYNSHSRLQASHPSQSKKVDLSDLSKGRSNSHRSGADGGSQHERLIGSNQPSSNGHVSRHVSHTDRSSRVAEPIMNSREMAKRLEKINSSSAQDIHRLYNDRSLNLNIINGNSQVIKISSSDPASLIGSGRRAGDLDDCDKPMLSSEESPIKQHPEMYQQQEQMFTNEGYDEEGRVQTTSEGIQPGETYSHLVKEAQLIQNPTEIEINDQQQHTENLETQQFSKQSQQEAEFYEGYPPQQQYAQQEPEFHERPMEDQQPRTAIDEQSFVNLLDFSRGAAQPHSATAVVVPAPEGWEMNQLQQEGQMPQSALGPTQVKLRQADSIDTDKLEKFYQREREMKVAGTNPRYVITTQDPQSSISHPAGTLDEEGHPAAPSSERKAAYQERVDTSLHKIREDAQYYGSETLQRRIALAEAEGSSGFKLLAGASSQVPSEQIYSGQQEDDYDILNQQPDPKGGSNQFKRKQLDGEKGRNISRFINFNQKLHHNSHPYDNTVLSGTLGGSGAGGTSNFLMLGTIPAIIGETYTSQGQSNLLMEGTLGASTDAIKNALGMGGMSIGTQGGAIIEGGYTISATSGGQPMVSETKIPLQPASPTLGSQNDGSTIMNPHMVHDEQAPDGEHMDEFQEDDGGKYALHPQQPESQANINENTRAPPDTAGNNDSSPYVQFHPQNLSSLEYGSSTYSGNQQAKQIHRTYSFAPSQAGANYPSIQHQQQPHLRSVKIKQAIRTSSTGQPMTSDFDPGVQPTGGSSVPMNQVAQGFYDSSLPETEPNQYKTYPRGSQNTDPISPQVDQDMSAIRNSSGTRNRVLPTTEGRELVPGEDQDSSAWVENERATMPNSRDVIKFSQSRRDLRNIDHDFTSNPTGTSQPRSFSHEVGTRHSENENPASDFLGRANEKYLGIKRELGDRQLSHKHPFMLNANSNSSRTFSNYNSRLLQNNHHQGLSAQFQAQPTSGKEAGGTFLESTQNDGAAFFTKMQRTQNTLAQTAQQLMKDSTGFRQINTPSSSTLPPRGSMGNMKSGQSPVLVEVLKQELLSSKRQLKDQQASNQFLKKEKLKVEHERNMLQIQFQILQEKLEEEQAKNEQLSKQRNDELKRYQEKDRRQKAFIDELQKMNELQNKENTMLQNRSQKERYKSKKEIDHLVQQDTQKEQTFSRKFEKVYNQILQLNSAAVHLQDLLRVSDQSKLQQSQISEYVDVNFQNSVMKVLKILAPQTPVPSLINNTSESTIEEGNESRKDQFMVESDKLRTRANNFKKFREQTISLINQLFDVQLRNKKTIITDLENELMRYKQDADLALSSAQQERDDLQKKLDTSKEQISALEKKVADLTEVEMPKVREKYRKEEQKAKEEKEQIEDELRSKCIKQKYELKEEREKVGLLKKENTQLKIELESVKYQVTNIQSDANQKYFQNLNQYSQKIEKLISQNQLLREKQIESIDSRGRRSDSSSSHKQKKRRTNSTDDLLRAKEASSNSLILERVKNLQMAKEKKKHDYFHSLEVNLLNKQITSYKQTVSKQSELINELTKKLLSSQGSIGGKPQQVDSRFTITDNQRSEEMKGVYSQQPRMSGAMLNEVDDPGIVASTPILHQRMQSQEYYSSQGGVMPNNQPNPPVNGHLGERLNYQQSEQVMRDSSSKDLGGATIMAQSKKMKTEVASQAQLQAAYGLTPYVNQA